MKTVNELLFENMMRFGRRVRGGRKSDGMEGRGPQGKGPMGCGGKRPPMESMHRPPMGGMKPPMGGPRGHKPPFSRERVLNILADAPDGMRQRQLAEALHITAPSVSELVNKLERDGYIARKADEDDKRATLLVLTDMGAARAREVQDEREQFVSKFFDKLTDEEKETLLTLLTKLYSEEE